MPTVGDGSSRRPDGESRPWRTRRGREPWSTMHPDAAPPSSGERTEPRVRRIPAIDVDDSPPLRTANCITCGVPLRARAARCATRARPGDRSVGYEEPLALTHIRGVPPPKWILRPLVLDEGPDRVRLQCRLRRCDAGDAACLLGNRGNEPMPLVVTAEELALPAAHAREQQEVPIASLNVDDLQFDRLLISREADVEVLPRASLRMLIPADLARGRPRCSGVRPQQRSDVRELRSTWRLLSSCRCDKGRLGRQIPRLRPPPDWELDAAAKPPAQGCCLLCHVRPITERCFPCHSPTLRPWIAGRSVHVAPGGVIRGGALEPDPRPQSEKRTQSTR